MLLEESQALNRALSAKARDGIPIGQHPRPVCLRSLILLAAHET